MEKWLTGGGFERHPLGFEKWFTDLPKARIAMEAGTHSIWVSEQLQEMGHEVIVANVRELRAISHSDRKSDTVDAEKIARYARLDPKILRAISQRTVAQQEALDPCPQPDRSSADGGGEPQCAGWRNPAAIVCQRRPPCASPSVAWPCCRQGGAWKVLADSLGDFDRSRRTAWVNAAYELACQ
jgi:hypothetical protein